MAHFLDHYGDRAVGQVLGQDGAVDGREGLLAGKAHGKHTEVALSRTNTLVRGRLGSSWWPGRANPVLPVSCIWGMAGVDGFPLFIKMVLSSKETRGSQILF